VHIHTQAPNSHTHDEGNWNQLPRIPRIPIGPQIEKSQVLGALIRKTAIGGCLEFGALIKTAQRAPNQRHTRHL